MTTRAHKSGKEYNALDIDGPLFNLFAMNEGFWWPYRSFAKALMGTQKDASAYLEGNRKLLDTLREIVRKEQNLSLEIYNNMLEGMAEGDRPEIPGDMSDVNAMFERATEGLRKLGEAWMEAQVRSLDTMRQHASNGRKANGALHAPLKTTHAEERGARHH